MKTAHELIAKLGLKQHPEGGWYKETWRAEAEDGERGSATAILFLLETGEHSHWHKVDATEIWLWHAGNPLQLSLSDPTGTALAEIRMGSNVADGDIVQQIVRPGEWQAAKPLVGEYDYTLVSCVVSPAFDFAGFTLAPPDWQPGE
ncbi:MAG: cupin domain-containing protein [Alteraurantiacibacter sp.]